MSSLSNNPAAFFLNLLSSSQLRRNSNNRTSPTSAAVQRDIVHIDGGLHEVRTPFYNEKASETVLHVILRFEVSFILSRPLHVRCIKAHFEGSIDVADVGQLFHIQFLHLQWVLWDKGVLEAGRKYEFEVVAEIPPTAPCSVETRRGSIEYTFRVQLEGVEGECSLRTKQIRVWNPYMVFDVPRMNLAWSDDLDSEMVGTTVRLGKALEAFIRYPDQCFTGLFPCHECLISLL